MERVKDMITVKGQTASEGLSLGRLHFYRHEEPKVDALPNRIPQEERVRLSLALEKTAEELALLEEKTQEEVGAQEAAVFSIHRMMLEDEELLSLLYGAIDEGYSAEYAVKTGADTVAARLLATEDDYMKERALDVKDVAGKLVSHLVGRKKSHLPPFKEGVILCAEELTPGETVLLDKSRVAAFVLSGGSVNSHTAILARSMGVPAVVAVGEGLFSLPEGELALVDASQGKVTARPDEDALALYALHLAAAEKEKSLLDGARGKVIQNGGRQVEICGNIGSVDDVEAVKREDGDGVGLFRSEFLFLGRKTPPDEEEQFQAYQKVLLAMGQKRVVVRTLDIGADKKVPYLGQALEENPAMGLRGIRLCLEEEVALFRTQLRALLRASAYGKLAILFPMISSRGEVVRAKALLKEEAEALEKEGLPFSYELEIGIMIETPAAALISGELAEEVDFFSVGTNDLSQYTLAIDRQNARAARFFDPHHEAVLSLIALAAQNAHKNGIWIGICGELAADKMLASRFLAMGIDELSMVPNAILPMKAHLLSLGKD